MTQWTNGPHIGRRPTDHSTRILTHCVDTTRSIVDRDHGGLEQDNPHPAPKDNGVRSPEINRKLSPPASNLPPPSRDPNHPVTLPIEPAGKPR